MELQKHEPLKNNTFEVEWKGPYSWIGYENQNNLTEIPDINGVYLWTFEFKNGYLVYCAGITKSTKRRFKEHTLEYKSGNYTVFEVKEAEQGKRVEIWHGWSYAREHRDEFNKRKEEILDAVDKQLKSFKVFVAEIPEKRMKARLESAIMQYIYSSDEPWSKVADRGMHLSKRKKDETPIRLKNFTKFKIYGIPKILEI